MIMIMDDFGYDYGLMMAYDGPYGSWWRICTRIATFKS